MTAHLALARHQTAAMIVGSIVIIGAGLATMVEPALQPLSVVAVGTVIGFAVLAPYLPIVDIGHPPMSLVGIFIGSIGIFGIITELGPTVLMWVYILGGIGMILEEQIRRRR
ncbi:hypothetical protein [Natrinema halophilum]|uniref:Uncharacterized protein n=1 Tax=Natrinema halophilum TaxID=1699371 RepID=A0A7D5GV19_9EURY|nr:hypothetical protein [Natrinema halophilum]QLG50486.1 hypothetical protein HYG82_17345 [Natrinema halophilum]